MRNSLKTQVRQMFQSKIIRKLHKANTFFWQKNKEQTNKTKKQFLFGVTLSGVTSESS